MVDIGTELPKPPTPSKKDLPSSNRNQIFKDKSVWDKYKKITEENVAGQKAVKIDPKKLPLRLDGNLKDLITNATTTSIKEVDIGGEAHFIKVIRDDARFFRKKIPYSQETRQEYLHQLQETAAHLNEYSLVIRDIFGSVVVPSYYFIAEDQGGKPCIMSLQKKINGFHPALSTIGGEESIGVDYAGRGTKPYRTIEKEDPHYEQIREQLQIIYSIVKELRSGTYQPQTDLVRQFIRRNPRFLGMLSQIDVRSGDNILLDENKKVRIIDW